MTGKSLTGIALKSDAIEPKVDSRVMPGVRRVKGTIRRNGTSIRLDVKDKLTIFIAEIIVSIETIKKIIISMSNCLSISVNFDAKPATKL